MWIIRPIILGFSMLSLMLGLGWPMAVRAQVGLEPTLLPTPVVLPTPLPGGAEPAPDMLEDNWSIATAAPIAVGVIYDLTFACPVVGGCPGGDHDYLALPVKAGLRYVIATFDLGPGVDTVLDLFWGDPEQPLLSNDDLLPGAGFLSRLIWQAPSDGVAILRVAPRAGGVIPHVTDPQAGSYRLAVALVGSSLANEIAARIAAQNAVPSPTPLASSAKPVGSSAVAAAPPGPEAARTTTADPGSSSAQGSAGGSGSAVPQGDAFKGRALVLHATSLRLRPGPDGELIEQLAPETVVTLLGNYRGLWVRVQTDDAVIPGWILVTDLRRLNGPLPTAEATSNEATSPVPAATSALDAAATTPTAVPVGAEGQTSAAADASPGMATGLPVALKIEVLDPLPVPAVPPPVVYHSRSVTVSVVALDPAVALGPTPTRATPTASTLLAGVRVQLLNAFGDVLAEAVTTGSGPVVLTRDIAAGAALFVRLPTLGLLVRAEQPVLQIALPVEPEP
ncbi:MAG: SH3 domain-containing protein [Oscillochloridaceae bacterium umkhey_bin13]